MNPLQELIDLCEAQAKLEKQIEEKEAELAEAKKTLDRLSKTLIPDMMTSYGMTELRLLDGSKLSIKPEVFANVPKERMGLVMEYLRENNEHSIAKTEISIDTKNLDQGSVDAIRQKANELGIELSETATIHNMTLRSYVKDKLSDPTFPRELFGVHEGSKAVITKAR